MNQPFSLKRWGLKNVRLLVPHSLNIRGAFLHMVGDLLTSVAVLVNGLLLMFYPWYWLDPLLSVLKTSSMNCSTGFASIIQCCSSRPRRAATGRWILI